jgi:UDP-N-acetylglucosamine:LPS N-acetylglucosamine transferase
MVLEQIRSLPISALIVSGKPGAPEKQQITPRVQQVNHMNAKDLNEAMLASKMVLSRSGYTTLMDLVKLNKKAILIPTPGQSEQEYLGKFLMRKGYFYNVPQHTFNLKEALDAAEKFAFKSFEHEQDMEQYKGVVRKFVESLG